MKKIQVLIFILCFSVLGLHEIHAHNTTIGDTILPKVFLMGDYEKEYDKMKSSYSTSLLSACNNDTDITFDKWARLLLSMEAYAKEINYDVNGVKMWIEVYCDADGTIKHIAYFLKPNSRNIDTAELNGFMMSFMSRYKVVGAKAVKFYNNGHASFPVF